MKKLSEEGQGKKAQVLSSQIVYEGNVFGIRRDEVIEPSGVRTTREMITHPGSVVVLPVLPDERVLLIQQYRYAARQYLWELVAGRIDEGETPLQAAARELKEETGFSAKRFRIFLEFFPTPGFLEEKMFLLLAEGLTPGKATPEDDEKIVARPYTHKQLDGMLRKAPACGRRISHFVFSLRSCSSSWRCLALPLLRSPMCGTSTTKRAGSSRP